MSTELCDYGCGKPATHTFKNGKRCCSKSINSCPEHKKARMKGILEYSHQMASTIDPENGLTLSSIKALRREENKRQTVDPDTGLTMNTVGAIRAAETKSKTVDPVTGLNINQIAGLKSYQTTSTTIDPETGLTLRELQGKQHSEHLAEINQETGLPRSYEYAKKGLETKLQIGEDGLNSFERGFLNSLKMYYYKDTKILYQSSLEKKFLEKVEKENGIEWLQKNVQRGPNIEYFHPIKKQMKIYMPDFLVADTIYEIKSLWTWNGNGSRLDWQEINEAKIKTTKEAGWNIELIIFS